MERVAIIGAGAHAREVLDVFEALNAAAPRYDVLGFLVDAAFGSPGMVVHEKPVLGDLRWFERHGAEARAICAIGAPELRRRVVERARAHGARFTNAIHPATLRSRWLTLGEGVVIFAGCTISNQVAIGDHAALSFGCNLSHDTQLGAYATLAPGVRCAGGVVCEDGCAIGTGASVIPRIRLGAWSIVGAGAAVIRDVPPNSTVVGVPGRLISQRAPGWHLN